MLTYFPTPYPGEWWYSVLCRYHVRSGNTKQQTTVQELFPGRTRAAIGSVLPNNTMKQIISQLSPGILKSCRVFGPIPKCALLSGCWSAWIPSNKEKVGFCSKRTEANLFFILFLQGRRRGLTAKERLLSFSVKLQGVC